MSTRCMVKIKGSEVQFYHHCDGYPGHMLPLFKKAVAIGAKPEGYGWDPGYTDTMPLCRPEKAGALLCAADQKGWYIEPNVGGPDGHHADIEFAYEIHLEGNERSLESICWKVRVFEGFDNLQPVGPMVNLWATGSDDVESWLRWYENLMTEVE